MADQGRLLGKADYSNFIKDLTALSLYPVKWGSLREV
jgi:hypothetical protein